MTNITIGEEYSKKEIASRLNVIRQNTGEDCNGLSRASEITRRLAYEFGVDSAKYKTNMSTQELVDTTFEHQTHPSNLEEEIIFEADCLEKIRAT